MSIDEKKEFHTALIKGSTRLVAIIVLLIVIIMSLGMTCEYFDLHPQISNEFEYHHYLENYFIRCFLTGIQNLILLMGICCVTLSFFHILILLALQLGGYND